MKTTRIKWDEGMMTRCLARWTDYNLKAAVAEKQVPVEIAASDNSFKLDIPAASPVTNDEAVSKSNEWEDFKQLELATVRKQAPVKAAASDYSFELDMPSLCGVTDAKAAQQSIKWDDFKQEVDKAM